MITTEYLKKLGFKEKELMHQEKNFWGKVKREYRYAQEYRLGSIRLVISAVENDSPFWLEVDSARLGTLPEDKAFLELLVKHYG